MDSEKRANQIKILMGAIVTGLILIVAILTGILLQRNQSPTDTSASERGTADVVSVFKLATCDSFINSQIVSALPSVLGVSAGSLKVTTQASTNSIPLSCYFDLGSNHFITLEVHAYGVTSTIDASLTALQTRINRQNNFVLLSSGTQESISYSFGSSQTIGCITNIFHKQMDFEYIKLIYEGFDCASTTQFNKSLMESAIIPRVQAAMVGTNYRYPGSTN